MNILMNILKNKNKEAEDKVDLEDSEPDNGADD